MKRAACSIALTAFALTACQTPDGIIKPDTGGDTKLAVLLQQVDNLDTRPNTAANYAKLFKLQNHCLIEFHGVHQSGKATEYWNFKGSELFAAYTLIVPEVAIIQQKRNDFDVQDVQVRQNFMALKKHFAAEKLAQCQ